MLRRARRSLRQVLCLMARRPALLCGAVVLAVLLVLAVKFTCSRAKNVVAAARPPLRFFSTEAPVVDLYLGQLDQVDRLRSMAEVSLIFFYAPWCAHSMAARQEVQLVAKKLAKQVQFVAVNCWWSQGKCRRQNQFYKYPTIHLFYRRFGPIEYKGPLVAPYVESFVLRVITPLTYLPSRASLEDFLSCHEPRVVGFFQFNSSPQPPGYVTYLSAALQALKRDFRGVVRFGVVTSRQVAERISVREDETVYLHRRLNSSLIFPRWERNFTSSAISSWVFEHHESVLQWLQPPGTKSHLLEHELAKGPALLLFLPHNPLRSEPSPLLQQMADVAVRYHSCDTGAGSASRSPCCRSEVASPATVCEVCVAPPATATTARRCCFKLLPSLPSVSGGAEGCSNVQHSYSPFSLYSACCRRSGTTYANRTRATEAPPAPPPPQSPPSPSASASLSSSSSSSLTGLRCQTNRTLRFYVLDVALNWALAVRLGAAGNGSWAPPRLDPAAHADGSFATIVNLKDEVHYVLQRSPTHTLTESLEAFIRNFSAPYSLLQRHLVGEDPKRGGQEGAEQRQPPPPSPQQRRPLITELTTSSFLPSVMDIQRDVLLFYYTQWCGFCSVLNHVMIQLARLLQRNSTITVARVNVARNDLPWEFMVDHVPSILFFPRYRKHLSVKFPEELPITLPNLLDFILQHSGSPHYTDKPASAPGHCGEVGGSGPAAVLRAEFVALQQEVQALHHARERLSQQLAQLWRENRQLALDARGLREHNGQLQRERRSLEEQHRLKSRQLGEALRRLQQLADASQSLLSHNAVLRLLLNTLKDRSEVAAAAAAAAAGEEAAAGAGAEPSTGHMAS